MKHYLLLGLSILVTLCGFSQNNTVKKKILMVVANPTIASTTNKPVGFSAAELTHPYYEFTTLGWSVVIVSPNGGKVEMNAGSNPQNSFALAAKNDVSTLGYLQKPKFL